jgi:hypothetical protein
MTAKFVRCRHCNVQYAYHPSGDISRLNNDTYCPECYSVILKALKDVPAKKRSVWVAAAPMSPVTIEEFNTARDGMYLKVSQIVFSDNIQVQCGPSIKGEHFRLCVNKDDGSQLLEIECEEDVATGVITGTWNCAGFASLHESEEARKLSKEFWAKSRIRDFSKMEVRAMAPPTDTVYYLKPVYKSSVDAVINLPDGIQAELTGIVDDPASLNLSRGFGELKDDAT